MCFLGRDCSRSAGSLKEIIKFNLQADDNSIIQTMQSILQNAPHPITNKSFRDNRGGIYLLYVLYFVVLVRAESIYVVDLGPRTDCVAASCFSGEQKQTNPSKQKQKLVFYSNGNVFNKVQLENVNNNPLC